MMIRPYRLIGFVLLAAIVLTGCGGRPKVASSSAPIVAGGSVASPIVTAVSITGQAFTPATLTVPVGTTVTWTNHDQLSHTVSSDPYPINTDLAGFDSVQPIQPTKSYSFTFTKVGTWSYHDQLRPTGYTGTIVVTKNP